MDKELSEAVETLVRCGLSVKDDEAAGEIHGGKREGQDLFGHRLITIPFTIAHEGNLWKLKILYGNVALNKSDVNLGSLVNFICAFYNPASDSVQADLRRTLLAKLHACGAQGFSGVNQDQDYKRSRIIGNFRDDYQDIEIVVLQEGVCFLVFRIESGTHSEFEFCTDRLPEVIDYLCDRSANLTPL